MLVCNSPQKKEWFVASPEAMGVAAGEKAEVRSGDWKLEEKQNPHP
jgi:hypothetical protein